MEETNTSEITAPVRPQFLKVLCILTFIMSGIGSLLCIIMPLVGPKFLAMMQQAPDYDPNDPKYHDGFVTMSAGWSYYLIMFVISLVALFGAIQMWKLKKTGYALYVTANILMFIIPIIMIGVNVSYFSAAITILFIVLYGLNLKHMK